MGMILVNKVLWKLEVFKKVINKKHKPTLTFFNEKSISKDLDIFWRENWIWKSEISIFWSLDLERKLIYPKLFFMEKSYFPLK